MVMSEFYFKSFFLKFEQIVSLSTQKITIEVKIPFWYKFKANKIQPFISVPDLELLSRAVPSSEVTITAQSVQPQGEIQEKGREKKILQRF